MTNKFYWDMKMAIIFCCLSLFLSGCAASLDDFQGMSTSERADYICGENEQVQYLGSQVKNTSALVDDTETAIARGYRIHKSCQRIPTVVPVMDCSSIGYFSCSTTTNTVYNTVCSEAPVAIDGDLEKEKLSGYRVQLESVGEKYFNILSQCRSPLLNMTAEEAFSFYKREIK